MAVGPRPGGAYMERPRPSGLADVIDIILDKGLVVDAYVRVALAGIEILTVDARIVIASVDTYLRFADAVGRLNLAETGAESMPHLLETGPERLYKSATVGAIDGVVEGLFGRSD